MIRKTIDIVCKTCETRMRCGIDISDTSARTIAANFGWKVSAKYGDLCPRCAELPPERSTEQHEPVRRLTERYSVKDRAPDEYDDVHPALVCVDAAEY